MHSHENLSDELLEDKLLEHEYHLLSDNFKLIPASQRDSQFSTSLSQLLQHEHCEKLLYQLTPVIHSPSIKVTASLLSKRYAFLVTASSLYAMSVFDKGLNFSYKNCFVDFCYHQKLWRSKMPLQDLTVTMPNNNISSNRQQWREQIISQIFANNLALFWQVLVDVTNIHPRILWENTAVRVYSLYEKKMPKLCKDTEKKIQEDFIYLTEQAGPEVFGIDYNPLKKYNFKKVSLSTQEQPIRFRKSCCFYYKATDPFEYCSNCPLVRAVVVN
ncbi:IucA/IucC family C-terminal-domain containing protein [Psychrobacter sp. I-STPA10]|uniref:IucA/IucC family C-terminal-domain containing protein n=1 Tax=Psychrobacter sp. I-STPA10 TaxID=2585769 RepID=UPI001E601F78|nr:IucA/IucC family C-terminal-domain containing protein [Psychrobacter sp. I-STPA10]